MCVRVVVEVVLRGGGIIMPASSIREMLEYSGHSKAQQQQKGKQKIDRQTDAKRPKLPSICMNKIIEY